MSEQARAGWYPDGYGNERYWDGTAWTDQLRALSTSGVEMEALKKEGALGRLGARVKQAAADKRAAKEELLRKQEEDARAAGALVTSGVFGTSTVEIYENGFVRVASWAEGLSAQQPKSIERDTPYEKLRSIKFTQTGQKNDAESSSALEGAVGPAVASLLKGGKNLMKASAPGLAMAGVAHLASNEARKTFLTIATDRQIHTLTNQRHNGVMKTSNKGHNEVGLALEAAGNAVLGIVEVPTPDPVVTSPTPDVPQSDTSQALANPTIGDRIRELAALHADGILSEEEFAAAKAKLLGSL